MPISDERKIEIIRKQIIGLDSALKKYPVGDIDDPDLNTKAALDLEEKNKKNETVNSRLNSALAECYEDLMELGVDIEKIRVDYNEIMAIWEKVPFLSKNRLTLKNQNPPKTLAAAIGKNVDLNRYKEIYEDEIKKR